MCGPNTTLSLALFSIDAIRSKLVDNELRTIYIAIVHFPLEEIDAQNTKHQKNANNNHNHIDNSTYGMCQRWNNNFHIRIPWYNSQGPQSPEQFKDAKIDVGGSHVDNSSDNNNKIKDRPIIFEICIFTQDETFCNYFQHALQDEYSIEHFVKNIWDIGQFTALFHVSFEY